MIKHLISCYTFLLLGLFIYSQNNIISFNNNANTNENSAIRFFNDKGLEGIDVRFEFDGIYNKLIKANNNEYSLLNIKDFSYLKEVGKPALPAHNEIIAIPLGANISLRIEPSEIKVFENFLIYPALKPATDQYGASDPEFEIDEQFYNSDIVYPQSPVQIIDTLIIRGVNMLIVQICPLQYNPLKKEIYAHTSVSFSIDFKKADRFFDYEKTSQHFLNIVTNFALNGESIHKENQNLTHKDVSGPSVNYIIITHNNYLAAADSMAKWKAQLGYSVEVVSSSSWTSASVKSAIQQRYQNWTPKPDYFLIIGDHSDVPGQVLTSSATGDSYASDIYYACMDGTSDYMPDMARGRISVTSASEALNVVTKIINYERNPTMNAAFYSNGLNAAYFQDDDNDHYADRRFAQTSEDILNYMVNEQGFDVNRVYYTESSKNPLYWNDDYYANGEPLPAYLKKPNLSWNGTKTNINNIINSTNGVLYLFHRDHGYETGWGNPAYSNSDINNLNNSQNLPVVFSINCLTGKYYYSECFAEKFLRRANGGAVGVFAHGEVSYSGYNDGLSIGLIDAIWSFPGFIPNFTGSAHNPVGTPTSHSPVYNMGFVGIQGLVRMVQTWGNSKYTFELLNWFGDPAMRIWTANPSAITATHDNSIDCGDNYLNIYSCSINDALATIVVDGQLIGSTVLSSGAGSINIAGISGNEILLTISKHNYKPYISKINISSFCTPICDFTASVTATCTGVVQFTDNSTYMPSSWLWDFGDGITSTQQNPLHIYASNGLYTVKLKVANVAGSDSLEKISYVSVGMPSPPTAVGSGGCSAGNYLLIASGVGNIVWYDNPLGTNIVDTGNSFLTPHLSSTTEYYVQSVVTSPTYYYGGKPDNTGTGANFSSPYEHYLVFDVSQNVILKSVKVYATGSGNRTIYLKNSAGNTLQSATFYIPDGESRINLNFNIPPGSNYRLAGPVSPNLYRSNGSLSYPYDINGLVSITKSSASTPTSYYYYFYDWEVQKNDSCSSIIVPVTVNINLPPTPAFTCNGNWQNMQFYNNSINYDSCYWDFGDGNFSNEDNPLHSYASENNYNVSLTVYNSCGSNYIDSTLLLNNTGINDINCQNNLVLYPNPSNGRFFIVFNNLTYKYLNIDVINIAGQTIWSKEAVIDDYIYEIDLDNVSKGFYYLKVNAENNFYSNKLIIY